MNNKITILLYKLYNRIVIPLCCQEMENNFYTREGFMRQGEKTRKEEKKEGRKGKRKERKKEEKVGGCQYWRKGRKGIWMFCMCW